MPLLDTVVLFAVADNKDKRHSIAKDYMKKLSTTDYRLSTFAIFEFDIVLKSRGFSFNERMEKVALMVEDFPIVTERMSSLTPTTIFLTAQLEKELSMDYFDAGIASEALERDGIIVSTDRAFDKVPNLTRIW